jgi:flagellar biosynthetic protein FliO
MRNRLFVLVFLFFVWGKGVGWTADLKTVPSSNSTPPERNSPVETNSVQPGVASPIESGSNSTLANAVEPPKPEPPKGTMTTAPKETNSAPQTSAAFPTFSSGPSLWGMGLQSTGALLIVMTVIFLGSYLLKKMSPGRFGSLSNKRHLKMIETLSLGDKRNIHLLQIDEQMILLGSTSSQITVLEKLENWPARSAWIVNEASKNKKSGHASSEENNERRSGLTKIFSETLRSKSSHPSKKTESENFESILGKTIYEKKGILPSEESRDHASRLAALRESLQSHQ